MDSDDDDYESFSPPNLPSPPPLPYRRLKRLKKSHPNASDDPSIDPIDDPLLFPQVDFAKLEALENAIGSDDSEEETVLSQEESVSRGENESEENEDEDELGEVKKKTKRVLEFDADVAGGGDEDGQVYSEEIELQKKDEGTIGGEDLFEERDEKTKENKIKKKNGVKSDGGDDSKTNLGRSNKRREEKERKAYLKELHAESQRLLRETRDASFKPIPVVQKPISSVLEKIRKRKLEIAKKATVVSDRSYDYDGNSNPRDILMDLDVSYEEKEVENVEIIVEKEMVSPSVDRDISLTASNVYECNDAAEETIHENDQPQVSPVEEPTPAFRPPVHDTQDLFDDSEPIGSAPVQNDERSDNPSEEEFAPSILAMKLKLDSAPVDDRSSDEDDNDKENVNPHPRGIASSISSPRGDPVKDFIDEEAEEEDDSDNDLMRFQENEEAEDIEDFEELKDMIATGYEEKPIDNERRNELHQKWLEQQDAAGTDKLMQRLKCGSGLRDAMLLDQEPESDEDDEEFDDEEEEAKEDSLPRNTARINTRKAKEIILQLLPDKEDAYLSDVDDDSQRRHARRLLIRKEEQTTIVSPADDESSREVFGLIKKLNIVSDNKRKPKALSFFDSVLKGGNVNSSSKASFLGRASSHSIPSSHKQGSGTTRSFIFGREDSNSRSAMSMSEDSSDTVSQEIRPTRNLTAKYSSSQTKCRSQSKDASSSKTSLFEILKRSSTRSLDCNQENTVDLTKGIFAFRVPKKATKIEGRS